MRSLFLLRLWVDLRKKICRKYEEEIARKNETTDASFNKARLAEQITIIIYWISDYELVDSMVTIQ